MTNPFRRRWTVYYVWSRVAEKPDFKKGGKQPYASEARVVARFWRQETAERCADALWTRAHRTNAIARGTYRVSEVQP